MTKAKENLDINYQPRIVGFVCNWGAYSGVEMAGVERREYPTSIKLVRLMCLGRLHLGLILKAFELGADGVMLLGCPPGNCHYESGMEKAKEMFTQASKMLDLLGIDRKRLALVEVPLGGGDLLAKKVSGFAKRVSRAGSSPLCSNNNESIEIIEGALSCRK
ncbi:hydrogenase iron-sulfur subunit [Chloroflexota bacterium]